MKNITPKPKRFLLGLMLVPGMICFAQDTIRITLPEAEKQFITQNLSLLAAKYNITISKAQVIQAKLYNNPNLSFSGALYNPDQKKFADISNGTGEYTVSLQQLIILAGKRNKQIKMAETNTGLSEQKFFDLLRTLRYSLRSIFYNAYYLQNSIDAFQYQLGSLEQMNTAYKGLLDKGVVSLKDVVRIQSLLYSIKADRVSMQNQLADWEAQLQLLLQNNKSYFLPVADEYDVMSPVHTLSLPDLIDTAYVYRYDLKETETNILFNQQNYSLQKALAVPDITLGAGFDKRGSYVNNASFLNASIDLPFFNRNKGNIRAAQASIEQSKLIWEQQKSQVEAEVKKAYLKALNTDNMLVSFDPDFQKRFQTLLRGITESFEKKSISLLEFADFYESYKNNIIQLNQLQNERMQAIEELGFAVGKTIFNN